jgi:hypothetical protein
LRGKEKEKKEENWAKSSICLFPSSVNWANGTEEGTKHRSPQHTQNGIEGEMKGKYKFKFSFS